MKPSIEKDAGGEILGRLAGLAARPFVGAQRSNAVNKAVQGGITRFVNNPIERGLRKARVNNVIGKAVQVATADVPGTPRLFMKQRSLPERQALGQRVGNAAVHTMAHNPETLLLPTPDPISSKAYLGVKHVFKKAIGAKPAEKLASYMDSFVDELQKISCGDMIDYFNKHPEKLREKRERDRKKEKTAQVSPYQQQTEWTCSAACLKAVMAHYGTDVPEEEVAAVIGAREGRGAECNEIAEAARKLGFLAFEFSFESLQQAKVLTDQDIPIICDIQSFNHPGKGHYVILAHISDDTVSIMDPNTPGNIRFLSPQEMDERWWDRAMAPPHDLMSKWGIVIVPPEGSR